MPENEVLRYNRLRSATIGSIATDGSSYFAIGAPMPFAGEVRAAYFQNSTSASLASGTTTGSSASIVLHKNASSTASVIATFNGSGTTIATLGTATLLISGTAGSTNASFVAGDKLIGEVRGGAASETDNTGAFIVVDFMYGHSTGTTPTAGTGPA